MNVSPVTRPVRPAARLAVATRPPRPPRMGRRKGPRRAPAPRGWTLAGTLLSLF